jgi:hypothetical protein
VWPTSSHPAEASPDWTFDTCRTDGKLSLNNPDSNRMGDSARIMGGQDAVPDAWAAI